MSKTNHGYPDDYVEVGDVVEIFECFFWVGFKYGTVLKSHMIVVPPATHLKRSVAEVLAPDGTIRRVPFNFIKRVIKNDDTK